MEGEKTMKDEKSEKSLVKGIVAGAAAGLIATFVMTKDQNIAQNLMSEDKGDSGADEDPSTVKAANMITENLFDHKLEKDEKETVGQLMHYMMGGVSGLIYGAAAEMPRKLMQSKKIINRIFIKSVFVVNLLKSTSIKQFVKRTKISLSFISLFSFVFPALISAQETL